MNVVGYVRVSTEEQAQDGVSLTIQRDKIALYCQLHNLDLVGIEADEGVSAKTLKRPGLHRALDQLRAATADGLVVAKLDRLSRSVADWATLIDGYFGERAGKHLASVADSIDTRSAAGRLVLNMLMSVAQWERETISERVQEAMNHVKRKGHRAGQIPYGRRLINPADPNDKRMEDHPEEQTTIQAMRLMRNLGESYREIAAQLTAGEFPTKSGGLKPWEASSVRAILRRSYEHSPT